MKRFAKILKYYDNRAVTPDPDLKNKVMNLITTNPDSASNKMVLLGGLIQDIKFNLIRSYGFHFKRMIWKYTHRESFTADAVCVQRDIQLLNEFFGIPSKTLLEAYSRAFKRLEVEYLIGKRKREEEARKKLEAQLEFKEKLNSLYAEYAIKHKKLLDEASSLGLVVADPNEEDPL